MPKGRSSFHESLDADTLEHLHRQRRDGQSVSSISKWLGALGAPVGVARLSQYFREAGINPEPKTVTLDPAADLMTARLNALESDNRKLLRANAKMREAADRDLVLGDVVRRAAEESFSGMVAPTVPVLRTSRNTPQEFLAHISDAHYGEVVNPELTHGIAYNPEISLARLRYIGEKIQRYAELRPYPISVLHLAVLGDMLSGDNHEDLDVTNASVMADQTFEMGQALYEMITSLARSGQFGEVRAYIVRGNHPRAHKVPRHKQPHASWEYLMAKQVQSAVRMTTGLTDVTVEAPRSTRHIIDVAGYRVCLTHGDAVKAANFAGIPFYGLKARRDALQSMMRTLGLAQIDQISMGHFHQPIWWPGECSVCMNGAIKGADEYVMDTRYAATPAVQLLQEWHPVHKVTSVNHIDLDHVGVDTP